MSGMETFSKPKVNKPWMNWAIFGVTVVVVFLLGLFASSIVERRSESKLYFQMTKEIPDWEPRNEVWGENFPSHYESYMKTSDTGFASPHGGSATIDYLEQIPELVIMWAGYAFARDYKQGRGHFYAVSDVHQSLRTVQPQPATCWTCKSTDVPRLMNNMGIAEFYRSTWKDLGPEVVNHIGCQDCHDPKTMSLRITRPALADAFSRMGRDINKASHQEMRSLVCAQCHVEYYFKGEGKYLTFPWDKGFSGEQMEAYYDEYAHVDWTHALSKAPMIKAQHPDYELFMTGVHADRGISCADCHMPYVREGGIKYTNHHIGSPLANISGSCQVCHRESEAKLLENVVTRQNKVLELRRIVEKELARVHLEAKVAWDNGAVEAEMKPALTNIRHAQWRWDYVAAANGVGFHSPVESLRLLGTAIQKVNEARILITEILIRKGVKVPVALPDFGTKAKAQQLVGLSIDQIRADKKEFLHNTLPQWLEQARMRENSMP